MIRIVQHEHIAGASRGLRAITVRIDSLIEPRCTGMCGALAIKAPAASNSAQLKSSRSLMLTE